MLLRRLTLAAVCSVALACTATTSALAGSIQFTDGPAEGHVYTSGTVPSQLEYSLIGNSGIPSGAAECKLVIAGASPSTVDWQACNTAPFSHTGVPFAPGNRSDWTGGFGASTSTAGDWTFSVRKTIDSTLQSASKSWAIDNTAPTIDLSSVPALVNDATPTASFTVSDAHPGISVCGFSTSSGVAPDYTQCTSPYTHASSLADGNYFFWVNATDATGEFTNQSVNYKAITVDTTPPSVSIASFTSPSSDNTLSFSFSVTGGTLASSQCRYFELGSINPPGWGACSSPGSFSPPQLADGAWTVEVRNDDAAGNIGFDTKNIVVDTTPPNIAVTSPTAGQVLSTGAPNPAMGATDPAPGSDVATLECAYDVEAYVDCDAAFLARILAAGQHSLNVRATDGVGNVSTSSVAFSIDLTPPVVDPPETTPPTVSEPATASSARFKRVSGKVSGSKYNVVVSVAVAVPAPACAGSVALSLTHKAKGKKAKSYGKSAPLAFTGGTCAAKARFALPKALKGKRVAARARFGGSAKLRAFSLTGSINKL